MSSQDAERGSCAFLFHLLPPLQHQAAQWKLIPEFLFPRLLRAVVSVSFVCIDLRQIEAPFKLLGLSGGRYLSPKLSQPSWSLPSSFPNHELCPPHVLQETSDHFSILVMLQHLPSLIYLSVFPLMGGGEGNQNRQAWKRPSRTSVHEAGPPDCGGFHLDWSMSFSSETEVLSYDQILC